MTEQQAAHDPVNHPTHYTSHPSGVEVIEFTRLLPFGPGNAVKYVMRRGLKGDGVEDVDKAIWYLEDSAGHEVFYYTSGRMTSVIRQVLPHEDDPDVAAFLRLLYLPAPGTGLKASREFYLAADHLRALRGRMATSWAESSEPVQ